MRKPTPRVYPTQDRIRELLDYDPATGYMIWRPRGRETFAGSQPYKSWHSKFCGKAAGYENASGHILVKVDGVQYRAHRLVWILLNGSVPSDMVIDHIDGNPLNNVYENLRCTSMAVNMRNVSRRVTNTSGVTGVYFDKAKKKWHARISNKFIGYYASLDDAERGVKEARRLAGYSDRHGSQSSRFRTQPKLYASARNRP